MKINCRCALPGLLCSWLFFLSASCGETPSRSSESRSLHPGPLSEETPKIPETQKVTGGAVLILRKHNRYELDDKILPSPQVTQIYHPLVLDQVKRVFHDFGDLYVSPTVDSTGKEAPQVLEVKRPWSGFWYKMESKVLYDGPESPLAKFDALAKAMGRPSHHAQEEEATFRKNISFYPWEGNCMGRSVASILTPEPTTPLTTRGITFSQADQKAILTFSHLNKALYERYGVSYDGSSKTDGTRQDIKPEALLKLVIQSLGHDKRALVVDTNSGSDVWNEPLYKWVMTLLPDPQAPDYALLGKAYVKLVKARAQETNDPTTIADTDSDTLNFRLYTEKAAPGASPSTPRKVTGGQWIGPSFERHFDTASYVKPSRNLGSYNTKFNENIDLVQEIFIDRKL